MSWSADNLRYCAGCRKALKACVCELLEPFPNRIPIDFVVSPEEQAQARNTSWLAHRLLSNSSFQEPELLFQLPERTGILYPAEDAGPWSEHPDLQRLIVPDDTWDKTRRLLREHPVLQRLPRIRLENSYEGLNQVRRPPTPGALSTAEAVGHFLLEQGDPRAQRLITLIERLNKREQQFRKSPQGGPLF